MFGTRENFRTESLQFEVANFSTTYHVVLGRLGLAKFMVIPHYMYLVMKMPAPNGILCSKGDVRHSYLCDKEICELAKALILVEESCAVATRASSSGEGT